MFLKFESGKPPFYSRSLFKIDFFSVMILFSFCISQIISDLIVTIHFPVFTKSSMSQWYNCNGNTRKSVTWHRLVLSVIQRNSTDEIKQFHFRLYVKWKQLTSLSEYYNNRPQNFQLYSRNVVAYHLEDIHPFSRAVSVTRRLFYWSLQKCNSRPYYLIALVQGV